MNLANQPLWIVILSAILSGFFLCAALGLGLYLMARGSKDVNGDPEKDAGIIRIDMTKPTKVCAWCSKTLSIGNPVISHGICVPCSETKLEEAGLPSRPLRNNPNV